jgi:hypothetical protein
LDNKRLSKKREVSAAKDIGGKNHVGSGNQWFCKNDMSDEIWSCEDKFTNKDKYSIQYSVISKLEKHTLKVGKLSVLRFGFENEKRNFAVIETKHFNYIHKTTIFTTSKNSILFKLEDLIKLENNDIMCEIYFSKFDKKYYILTWEYFVEIHNNFK